MFFISSTSAFTTRWSVAYRWALCTALLSLTSCDNDLTQVSLKASGSQVYTLAGNGSAGFANGKGTDAQFRNAVGVAADAVGNVFVADSENDRIRKIAPDGQVSTLAGDTIRGFKDGEAATAQFDSPYGIAVDATGNVYVADTRNYRIRKIANGQVTTLAGNGTRGFANGPAASAQFGRPTGVAVDAAGNVYVADAENHCIRKIAGGQVTTLAGSEIGTSGFADGAAASALFNIPFGLALDSASNVLVADVYNFRIRRIANGQVTTVAGTGVSGFADGPATSAQFNLPYNVAVDAKGNVLVADGGNNRIRKITRTGIVSILAGSTTGGLKDGPATAAQFSLPVGLAVNGAGHIFVADYLNSCIRRIEPK